MDPEEAADESLVRGFDLQGIRPEFLADPFPTYHALRAFSPVHRFPDGSVFLSRYDHVSAVYRDPARFVSDKRVDFAPKFGESLLFEHHTTSLVFNDAPAHTRVRRLLAPFFTPRAMAVLEPRLIEVVDRLLDRAEERGRFDLIEDLATAVPIQLIGDMLGIPEGERGSLRGWSLAILGALEPVLSEEQLEAGNRAVSEFKSFLGDLIDRHRRGSLDSALGEIIRVLIRSHDEDDDGLTSNELLHNCIFLLNAGHETTTNLIGNGVDALLRFPGELARLRQRPELIDTAVDEFLRFESSNQLGNRRLSVDAEIGGEKLPAGTILHLGIGAANRDPGEFQDPDRLDIERKPNRHLAFGLGIHACAGKSLARMEGRVSIGRLVARFPRIEPAGEPMRGGRARFRGFRAYPVSVR